MVFVYGFYKVVMQGNFCDKKYYCCRDKGKKKNKNFYGQVYIKEPYFFFFIFRYKIEGDHNIHSEPLSARPIAVVNDCILFFGKCADARTFKIFVSGFP